MISFPIVDATRCCCWSLTCCLRPFRISALNLKTQPLLGLPSFHHVCCGGPAPIVVCQTVHLDSAPMYVWIYSMEQFQFPKFVLLPRTWNCILRSMLTDVPRPLLLGLIRNKNRKRETRESIDVCVCVYVYCWQQQRYRAAPGTRFR